ncbi:hypothetical protein AQ477_05220 [Burkholderia thailandensis]|nr:hypothetical protein AQ477_05220 [Burkholderia thailandensis]PNE75926.1 hypothetical protein A8H37_30865 [Burkholderia thailandensis]
MAGHAPDRGATRRAATIGRSKARHTAGIDARACAGARAFERPDVAASGQARVRRGPIRMRGRRAEAAARSFFGVDAKFRAPVGHLERVAAAAPAARQPVARRARHRVTRARTDRSCGAPRRARPATAARRSTRTRR